MKILFIISTAENIGVEYLSAFLKLHGHDTFLLFDPALSSTVPLIHNKFIANYLNLDDKIIENTIKINPDIIAFSCVTGTYRWSLKIAELIRNKSDIPIVFGGIHPTSVPKEVMQHKFIDYVIVGEGEYPLLELLDYIDNKKDKSLSNIQNLVFRNNGNIYYNPLRNYIKDIDSFPFPDKDLLYNKAPFMSETYLIMISRGCPFNCTYCCNNIYHSLYLHQNHVRSRSPQNVIDELKLAKEKWHPKSIAFLDDVFSTSTPWLEEFIPLYKKEIGLPFSCLTHPALLKKRDAELLKDGGCWIICMGVQTGSERMREDIYHRKETNEKILETVKCVRDSGIRLLSIDAILGGPTETKEDMKQTLDLFSKIAPNRIFTFWLSYYPNTEIVKIAKDNGYLSEEDIIKINEGYTAAPHKGGSIIGTDMKKMYLMYEAQLLFLCLTNNDKLQYLFSKIIKYLPFRIINQGIRVLVGIKSKDTHYIFDFFRYALSHKNVP